ncbi:unnamed protein product [Amoebophrya sp. A120]|nr:unnamed protein product [Amoebophrya sp. A120]|eukprot:GSA120T00007505001.1
MMQPQQQQVNQFGRPLPNQEYMNTQPMDPPIQVRMPPQIGDSVQKVLGPREGVLIKQTLKGCCCDLLNEFSIHEFEHADAENAGPEIMFAKESAGCFIRCLSHFAPGFRETSYDQWCGAYSEKTESERPKQPEVFLKHEKKCTNGVSCLVMEGDGGPLRVPCCCMLPYLETKDVNGVVLGKTQYLCDRYLFVPKYDVMGPDGTKWYRIRPDTCCGDCCVNCDCSQGGCRGRCCAIPFYLRDLQTNEILPGERPGTQAQITNLFSGLKECVNRENYSVRFPDKATPQQKATVIGATFLIEMLHFEQGGTGF